MFNRRNRSENESKTETMAMIKEENQGRNQMEWHRRVFEKITHADPRKLECQEKKRINVLLFVVRCA